MTAAISFRATSNNPRKCANSRNEDDDDEPGPFWKATNLVFRGTRAIDDAENHQRKDDDCGDYCDADHVRILSRNEPGG